MVAVQLKAEVAADLLRNVLGHGGGLEGDVIPVFVHAVLDWLNGEAVLDEQRRAFELAKRDKL